VTGWQPGLDWVVVEGCPCGGYFVEGRVFTERLPHMTVVDRETLVLRIRSFRAQRVEAWLTTSGDAANAS
jgi:hypothetical protein